MDWNTIGKWAIYLLGGGFFLRLIMWYPIKNALKSQEETKVEKEKIKVSSMTNDEYIRLIKQLKDEKIELLKKFDEYDKKFERQEKINNELMSQLGLKNKELIFMDDEVTKCKRALKSQSLCDIKEIDCPILIKYKELKK